MGIEHERCEAALVAVRRELDAARIELANVRAGLATARRIGAAIGVLVERLKITEDVAFEVLSRHSQATNRKLRDVADDLVLTGALDDVRPADQRDGSAGRTC